MASEAPEREPSTVVEVPAEAAARITARHARISAREAAEQISRVQVAEGALHAEEAARAQGFGRVTAVIAFVALVAYPVLDGDPSLEPVMYVATGGTMLVALWVALWGGRDERYRPWVFRSFGCSCVAIATLAEVYFGPFSPTPLIVTLGIAFFGQGRDRPWAVGLSFAAIALYLLLAALLTLDLMPDLGLFPVDDTPMLAQVFMTIMVPVVCTVTLWQARLSRAATEQAVASSQRWPTQRSRSASTDSRHSRSHSTNWPT